MGVFSIVTFAIGVALIFEGVYALVKGTFFERRNAPVNHEPKAYRTWVRLCGVLSLIVGVLLPAWDILEVVSPAFSGKSVAFSLITLIAMIVLYSVSYLIIVKPADKKAGVVSEFSKIIKDAEQQEADNAPK